MTAARPVLRALLAGLALLALAAPACASTSFRRMGHSVETATPTPPITLTLRSQVASLPDLSTDLALLDDSQASTLTVAAGSTLTVGVWLGSTVAANGSLPVVKRDLLDNLTVTPPTCATGASLGSFTVSGAKIGGGTLTQAYVYSCDNTAPATWAMGALTPAKFGGYPIHQYLPTSSDYTDWTLASTDQTITGQFVIRYDAADHQARVVLNGTAPTTNQSPGWSGWTGSASGPVAGTTSTVTIKNATLGTQQTIAISFTANEADAAPWPTDTTDTCIGNQFNVIMCHQVKQAAEVVMLEDGAFSASSTTVVGNGTSGFGHWYVSGLKQPYSSGWVYYSCLCSMGVQPMPNWLTIRSRNPLGASFAQMRLDARGITTSDFAGNPALGIRVTNVKTTSANIDIEDSQGTVTLSYFMIDHNDIAGGLAQAKSQASSGVPFQTAMFAIANMLRNGSIWYGGDTQIIGNRIDGVKMYVTDMSTNSCPAQPFGQCNNGSGANDLIHWAAKNLTPGSGHQRIAFNTFINAKKIPPLHNDSEQYDGAAFAATGENVDAGYWYGNIFFPGNRYTYTASDSIGGCVDAIDSNSCSGSGYGATWIGGDASQGQNAFNHDLGSAATFNVKYVANMWVSIDPTGLLMDKPGTGVLFKNNTMIFDAWESACGLGCGTPSMKFQNGGGGASLVIKDNFLGASAITYSVTTPGTESGNVFSADGTWQTTNLVNPAIGPAAHDRGTIVRSFAAKASPADPNAASKGPFAHPDKIDLWRQTADEAFISAP